MINSAASGNVCPKWFGESVVEKSNGSVRLRGADESTLQECGKLQIWLRNGNRLRRYDFHVVEVTKPIICVSCLYENGIEAPRETTHQILHEVKGAAEAVMQDEGSKKSCVQLKDCKKLSKFTQSHAYELKIHKSHAYEQESHQINKSHAHEQEIQKLSCVRAGDSQHSQRSCVRAGESQNPCEERGLTVTICGLCAVLTSCFYQDEFL